VRVVVLHEEPPAEPRPDEQDGQAQARAVARRLEELGHAVVRLPFGLDLGAARRALAELAPERVVNLVESVGGSGRLLHLAPALLEALRIPFTGAGSAAMLATSDKLAAKRLLAAAGLPTPAWLEARGAGAGAESGAGAGAECGAGRWVLKPVCEDASIGIGDDAVVACREPGRLLDLVAERGARLGSEVFAEAYVEGRELNLSLLAKGDGVEVLPPAEILFEGFPAGKPRIVGYAAKWDAASFEFRHTPRRFDFPAADAILLGELEGLARRAWSLFGLSGYARVDFRVDAAGRPWILELNANPCLSEDAGFAAAAARANLGPREVVERILAAAR
jgi:D-alanine-D-alanine ligase